MRVRVLYMHMYVYRWMSTYRMSVRVTRLRRYEAIAYMYVHTVHYL